MTGPSSAPIAVLDSSVLAPVWSRYVLQRLAVSPQPHYVPIWSEWIIAETWRVLTWRWLIHAGRTDQAEWRSLARAANRMLRQFLPIMTLVSLRDYAGPAPWPSLRDDDDSPVWQTAAIAGADYVVSHNLIDFPPLVQGRHVYRGVEYVTAIEFVEDVLGVNGEELYGAELPPGAAIRSRRDR